MELGMFLFCVTSAISLHYLTLVLGLPKRIISNHKADTEVQEVNGQIHYQCYISKISVSDLAVEEKQCQELKSIDWKEAYRECCKEYKDPGGVCVSRPDGTLGTYYYNLCSLYRERYLNPDTCVLRRSDDHTDCQRCGIKQIEPTPCDDDLHSEEMMCKPKDMSEIQEDRCISIRCMTDKEKEDDGKQCKSFKLTPKLTDWKKAFMQCCQEPKLMKPICGSRYNGSLGTYYYNECALIYDRYLNPDECILERMWDHNDCKRCGIKQTKAPICLEESTTDAPMTTTRPPTTPGRKDSSTMTPEKQVDQECARLRAIDWEQELLSCCGLHKGPQMVCGSRRDSTNGTFYYNTCALIRDRYLHPEDCILERRGDHDDCKMRGKKEHEPPGCPDYCNLRTYNTSFDARKYYFSPCRPSNATMEIYCGNQVPKPPIFPLRDCPLGAIFGL